MSQKKLIRCAHDATVITTKPNEKLSSIAFLLYSQMA
jgi:hypothetical protein